MAQSNYVDVLDIPPGITRAAYVQSLRQDVNRMVEESVYTPDAAALQRFEYQDVFLFGTWKSGFKRHHLLGGDIKPLGGGYTNSEEFIMYRTPGEQGFPIIVIAGNEQRGMGGAIHGQLWRIPTNKIFSLDFYEANGVDCKRLKLPVKYYDTKGFISHTFAWVWVGLRRRWEDSLKDKSKLILCDREHSPQATGKAPKYYYNYKWAYHAAS